MAFLAKLYEGFGAEHRLFGAIHFARCMGARLNRTDRGLQLVPGEMAEEEYAKIREAVLKTYGKMLLRVLMNM